MSPALSCTAPCWGGALCQVAGLLLQTAVLGVCGCPSAPDALCQMQMLHEKTLSSRAFQTPDWGAGLCSCAPLTSCPSPLLVLFSNVAPVKHLPPSPVFSLSL